MQLRASNGTAGYAGLTTCGSVWACPVCSAKILAHRATDIGQVLGEAVRQGHALGFVTLTMRHRRGQSLADLWDALGAAWKAAITGKVWQGEKSRHGVVGWVRVVEVTIGANGWHVHVHAVLVLAPGAGSAAVEELGSSMFGRWSRALERRGMQAPLLNGQDWHLVAGDQAATDLGRYLAKLVDQAPGDAALSLGLELTHTQPGRTADGLATRPVWSLLDAGQIQSASNVGRWWEWEQASRGRKQVGWSNGLRERFTVAPELDDLEAAELELGTVEDVLLLLGPDSWSEMVRVPQRIPALLDAAERGGFSLASSLLASWSIPYRLPRPAGTAAGPPARTGRRGTGGLGAAPPGSDLPKHRPGSSGVGGSFASPPSGHRP